MNPIRLTAPCFKKQIQLYIALIFVSFLIPLSGVAGENKSSEEIFKKWLTWQKVQSETPFVPKIINDDYARRLQTTLSSDAAEQLKFLNLPSSDRLPNFFRLMKNNFYEYLRYLKKNGFASEDILKREKLNPTPSTTEKYKKMYNDFLIDLPEDEKISALFSLANYMFESIFGNGNFKSIYPMFETEADYPVLRMLYANIWYNLSGNGWRYWHKNTLLNIKKESDAGRELVYIAGGSDIYYPLLYGVKKIRIIDPMLPSQEKYYSEGWKFLVKGEGDSGGIHDRITFDKFFMERVSYKEKGSFETGELSNNEKATLPISITEWALKDLNGNRIGYVIYERRFAAQNDFKLKDSQKILISFNELYYVATSGSEGWGFDTDKFNNHLVVYVKQLRRPVTATTIRNMRAAINSSFTYIKLGTSIN